MREQSQGYGWPFFGETAELKSLSYHAGLREKVSAPRPDYKTETLTRKIVSEIYQPAEWEIPFDFMSREHFNRVAHEIEWTSSPGYPYCLHHPTNAAFLRVKDGIPSEEGLEHLWSLVQQQIRDRICDPIRMFIKPEPHKVNKLDEGRYRIISSVSIVDQVIDQMLFGYMNDKLIENFNSIPSKAGWTQLKGGWKIMQQSGFVTADKSSWDWTAVIWLLELVLGVRIDLCRTARDENRESDFELWKDLATWRYYCLYVDPVFVTSGGLFLKQRQPGVLKSGCVNTIHDNSIMQVLLHVIVCIYLEIDIEWLYALGDDTSQREPDKAEQYFEELAKYCLLKQVEFKTEFAGHLFTSDSVEPVYHGKHAFALLHADEKFAREMADSYALLYHRSQKRDMVRRILTQLSERLPSLEVLDLIWDGDE